MHTYARIEDQQVREVLSTDREIATLFPPALTWADATHVPGVAQGWSFDGDHFTPPAPLLPPAPPAPPTLATLQAQLATLQAQITALSAK